MLVQRKAFDAFGINGTPILTNSDDHDFDLAR
jgi:hypothetical protein